MGIIVTTTDSLEHYPQAKPQKIDCSNHSALEREALRRAQQCVVGEVYYADLLKPVTYDSKEWIDVKVELSIEESLLSTVFGIGPQLVRKLEDKGRMAIGNAIQHTDPSDEERKLVMDSVSASRVEFGDGQYDPDEIEMDVAYVVCKSVSPLSSQHHKVFDTLQEARVAANGKANIHPMFRLKGATCLVPYLNSGPAPKTLQGRVSYKMPVKDRSFKYLVFGKTQD